MFNLEAIVDQRTSNVLLDMKRLQKQIPFAVASALTRTAKEILEAEQKLLVASLDSPTAYTKGSLRFKRADKVSLEASVSTKAPSAGNTNPASFLAPEIEGGLRSTKRFERLLQSSGLMPKGWRAVPAKGVQLDAFGNLPRALIGKLLKGLKGRMAQGPAAPTKGGKARKVKVSPYFVLLKTTGNKPPGIWERRTDGSSRTATPVVIYVTESKYKKKLDFYGTAQRIAEQRLEKNFEEELDKAIATAK